MSISMRWSAWVAVAAVLLCGFHLAECSGAERWTQFRGPSGQGLAEDAETAVEWDEKSNIAWKTELPGTGHSSPVVWDRQIWLTTASRDGKQLGVLELDRQTGDIRQNIVLLQPANVEEIHEKNSHASTTPVLAEGRLYAHFGTHGAACVDTASGVVLWRNENLSIEHQGGPGSSPVLFRDLLIVTCDGADQQYVAGLDCRTGQVRWKRARSAPYRPNVITHRAFATPLLIEHHGRAQLISPAADQLHAYDPETGAELWHVRYVGFSTVPCPAYANGIVYFCTGYFQPQLWAVKVDGRGDVTDSHVLWKASNAVPEIPSPLVHDGRVYTVSDKGVGTCLDAATGQRLWSLRLNGNYSASPLLAGKHLYFCSEEGLTKVVLPGDKPKVVATNKLRGRIMASPAAVGRELYLRTDSTLYRIEGRE